MQSTLCVLIGATEEQYSSYVGTVEKYGSATIATNWPDAARGLKSEEYVITNPPHESTESVVRLGKELGAEVVGIFFNNFSEVNIGFDRVVFEVEAI